MMLTCKLCGTELSPKKIRKDGSLLCPVCGQIYWKAAVEKATKSADRSEEIKEKYINESRRSAERIRMRLA